MPPYQITPRVFFLEALANERPKAMAWVVDNKVNPQTSGLVKFYQPSNGGVLVEAEVFGLPDTGRPNSSNFYAMHIHEFGNCNNTPAPPTNNFPQSGTNFPQTGNNFPQTGNNFPQTGSHFNPGNMPHPFHAGDLPPLLSNQGYAWTAFFDRRFTIDDIIGKSVIIHSGADDFMTQPSGDSGSKIACGDIRRTY